MNRYFRNITKHMNLKANKVSHREELVNILQARRNRGKVDFLPIDNDSETKN